MGRLDDRTLSLFERKPEFRRPWKGQNHMPALMIAFASAVYEALGIPLPPHVDGNVVLQYTRRTNRIEVYTWHL